MSIEITSPAFEAGATIPERHTCAGDDVCPPLQWSGAPEGTIEQALVVEDPDAPGGTFTHLMAAGLPANLDRLDDGAFPAGATIGSNDFGFSGWRGPCPPKGDSPHRYIFRILALSGRTGLREGFSAQDFHDAVQGLEAGRGELEGRFGRA